MIKTLIAGVAAATLLGSVVYVFAAGTEVLSGVAQLASNGNSFESRWVGTVCSERAWPYYDNSCLHDANRPGNRARTVRIVATDRPSAKPVLAAE